MFRKTLSLLLTLALIATFAAFPVSAATATAGVHTKDAFTDTVENVTDEYSPKVYDFVKTNGNTLITSHASNVPFTLPDAEYYVGDTIRFSNTFFQDNSFTYYYNGTTYDLTGASVYVYKYGESTAKIHLYSPEVSSANTVYSFEEPGTYVIASDNVYYDNGTITNKWLAWSKAYRFAVVEVKDPSTINSVSVPTTDKTSGEALTLTNAVFEYMSKESFSDASLKTSSIMGSNTFSVNATTPAGTILDVLFTFGDVSYVQSVSWTANSNNMFTGADVYGSLDGTDWYLLQDECNVTKSGTTYTFTVNGVAKYIKVKNFNFTSNGVSEGITNACATGFVLSAGDYNDGESSDPNTPTAETYFYPEYPEYTSDGDLILPRDAVLTQTVTS